MRFRVCCRSRLELYCSSDLELVRRDSNVNGKTFGVCCRSSDLQTTSSESNFRVVSQSSSSNKAEVLVLYGRYL